MVLSVKNGIRGIKIYGYKGNRGIGEIKV